MVIMVVVVVVVVVMEVVGGDNNGNANAVWKRSSVMNIFILSYYSQVITSSMERPTSAHHVSYPVGISIGSSSSSRTVVARKGYPWHARGPG